MREKEKQLRVGVIMAGGAGERFWPLSRRVRPKQLLALTSPDKSMLTEAVERLAPMVGEANIHIITGSHLVAPIRDAASAWPRVQVLAEPCKRNTAGALSYVAAWLMARHDGCDPDAITMAITTADHRIGDTALFEKTVAAALEAAERHDALVTCGVTPTHPETGFGYIEADGAAPLMTGDGAGPPVYRTRAFHEKPDAERAGQFVASGRHFWNSGMFFWKLSVFLAELRRAQPVMSDAITAMSQAIKAGDDAETARIFEGLESISIDYALMEKAPQVLVVKADFPWADVGAWNALATSDNRDGDGNYTVGAPVVIDCADCVVYNGAGADKMSVGVVGISNTIVVVTEDGVLVLPQERAQDVRAVVEELKRRDAKQL